MAELGLRIIEDRIWKGGQDRTGRCLILHMSLVEYCTEYRDYSTGGQQNTGKENSRLWDKKTKIGQSDSVKLDGLRPENIRTERRQNINRKIAKYCIGRSQILTKHSRMNRIPLF
jgi:hypothetical protein